MITRRYLSVALLLCFASASYAQTVALEQLWLPQSYLRHLPRLYDAAQRVDATSRCAQFITGSVAVDRSRLDHPVFTFTCRDHNRQTYALLVDGLTLHKLDDTRPEGFISFDDLELEYQQEQALAEERQRQLEELALQRAQREQERALQQRAERLWPVCWQALQARVGNMAELEWLTETMQAPDYVLLEEDEDLEADGEELEEQSEELEKESEDAQGESEAPEQSEHAAMLFVTDFNARDIAGQALRYRAHCTVVDVDEYQLDIKARRTENE